MIEGLVMNLLIIIINIIILFIHLYIYYENRKLFIDYTGKKNNSIKREAMSKITEKLIEKIFKDFKF